MPLRYPGWGTYAVAFPLAMPPQNSAWGVDKNNHGMTLRDYFAGQAIVGFLASEDAKLDEVEPEADLAVVVYRIADAMLAERDK